VHGSAQQPLRVGVLDQVFVRRGEDGAAAARECVELACVADDVGYARFWIAEHHDSPAFACGSPETLVAVVASHTTTICVGSGGVLLSLHAPRRVAETFQLLASLFPSRIDLGIGRAPGSDRIPLAERASACGDVPYDAKVAELFACLGHPCAAAGDDGRVMPRVVPPAVWLLGSSHTTATLAAKLGQRFCFAHFLNPAMAASALDLYRSTFTPSAECASPYAALAVTAICAESEGRARTAASSRHAWYGRDRTGVSEGLPSPGEAVSMAHQPEYRRHIETSARSAIVGTPQRVGAELRGMAERLGVAELVVTAPCHSFAARKTSYELLADALSLRGNAAAGHSVRR
jgi:luciferase family oxidoreductase group 1